MRESHTPDAKVTGPPSSMAHDGGCGSGKKRPTSTAELLARCLAHDIRVPCDCGTIRFDEHGDMAVYHPNGYRLGIYPDGIVRAFITVAAQEVVHDAEGWLVPPNERNFNKGWTLWMPGRTMQHLDAPDLASASVEAACRVKEAGR